MENISSSNNPMLYNRKRSRSHNDEEGSEFMPLSKRINNLHINNGVWKHVRQGEGTTALTQSQQPNYSPDLGPAENPYYYENNRLLYNLYLERAQRSGAALY